MQSKNQIKSNQTAETDAEPSGKEIEKKMERKKPLERVKRIRERNIMSPQETKTQERSIQLNGKWKMRKKIKIKRIKPRNQEPHRSTLKERNEKKKIQTP